MVTINGDDALSGVINNEEFEHDFGAGAPEGTPSADPLTDEHTAVGKQDRMDRESTYGDMYISRYTSEEGGPANSRAAQEKKAAAEAAFRRNWLERMSPAYQDAYKGLQNDYERYKKRSAEMHRRLDIEIRQLQKLHDEAVENYERTMNERAIHMPDGRRVVWDHKLDENGKPMVDANGRPMHEYFDEKGNKLTGIDARIAYEKHIETTNALQKPEQDQLRNKKEETAKPLAEANAKLQQLLKQDQEVKETFENITTEDGPEAIEAIEKLRDKINQPTPLELGEKPLSTPASEKPSTDDIMAELEELDGDLMNSMFGANNPVASKPSNDSVASVKKPEISDYSRKSFAAMLDGDKDANTGEKTNLSKEFDKMAKGESISDENLKKTDVELVNTQRLNTSAPSMMS